MSFFSYQGPFVKSSRKEEEEAKEVKKKGQERSVLSRSNKISFRMVLYRLPFSCPAAIGGLVSHSNDSLAPPSFHRSIAFVPPASIHLVVRKKGVWTVCFGNDRPRKLLPSAFCTREFVGHCGSQSRVCLFVDVVWCSCSGSREPGKRNGENARDPSCYAFSSFLRQMETIVSFNLNGLFLWKFLLPAEFRELYSLCVSRHFALKIY